MRKAAEKRRDDGFDAVPGRYPLPTLHRSVARAFVRVVLAFVLSGTALGSTGIWCAWPIGWMVATVISILFYRKGEWNTIPEEVREALMTESASM